VIAATGHDIDAWSGKQPRLAPQPSDGEDRHMPYATRRSLARRRLR
jgi:hypothetical protein